MDAGKIGSYQPGNLFPSDRASIDAIRNEADTPDLKDEVAITGDKAIAETSKRPTQLAEHVPSELLVRFRGDVPGNMRSGKIKLKLVKRFDMPKMSADDPKGALCHYKIESGQKVEDVLMELGKDKRIAYVEPNYIWRIPEGEQDEENQPTRASEPEPGPPQNKPNDLDPQLWGLNNEGQTGGKADADIDAPEAWNIAVGNNDGGPVIAVIDTGIDYSHSDLKNNIWTNPGEIAGDGLDNDSNGYIDDVHGYDFCNKDGDPMDDHGHGTHCAGTIAAEGNNGLGVVGVNWKAKVMPIKFLSASGSGSTADAVESLLYATKMGVKITSNSWSGGAYSQALKDTIDAFPGLFIAAAGNAGTDNDREPRYPGSYDSPNIIAVAATDSSDRFAYFSCYGKKSVDLAAPGAKIYSTVPKDQYGNKSGTSMATPHVAGAAGLIWSKYPELTAGEVKERLLNSVDKIPGFEEKMVSGGRLNVYNAIKDPPPAPPQPPENPPQQPPPPENPPQQPPPPENPPQPPA